MKRFLASGFGVGLFWKTYFGDKKGGGTLASLLFALITYVFNLNVLELSILFIVILIVVATVHPRTSKLEGAARLVIPPKTS